MNLLTLNTLSSEKITTREEVNELLLQLVYGIKTFLNYKEYKGSRFYTEESDIQNFEIIKDYKFKDAMLSLRREVLDFFSYFIDNNCDNNCLDKITDIEMENILNSDLYFDDEAFNGQKYIILSYSLEKKTFLLSFGKDRWTNHKVIANKVKEDGSSHKVILNNIANEEHSKNHYNEKLFEKLPKDDIFYTKKFKEWFFEISQSDIDKTIIKINFAMEHKLDRRDGCIGKIDSGEISDLYEIVVGSSSEKDRAEIRIFFKVYDNITYIIYGFIKFREEGMTYQEAGHIGTTLDIIKDEKLNEL